MSKIQIMKKAEDYNKHNKHFERWYMFLMNTVGLYFNTKPDYYPRGGVLPEGGNLILANHVTRMDQFIVCKYFEHSYIRFVSGENVFRVPLFRYLIVKFLNVIIHLRGISSFETIHEMTKSLKSGDNVMIFPTGTMTFSGKSQSVDQSIAKLAKMSGANLVLLQTNGGYFVQPRWGVNKRKGKISINERIIKAEELKQMKAAEVLAVINEHLYTDAYEKQLLAPVKYQGKQLCKGLECCIYECPACKKIAKMYTTDSQLICECGFVATYDEYGYLNGNKDERYTITCLCENQRENLKQKYLLAKDKGGHEFLFGDDFELTNLHRNGKRQSAGRIRVNVYSDCIEYFLNGDKKILNYDDIESVFVYMRNTLNVNLVGNEYGYELQGDFSNNALKYRDLYQIYDEKH